MDGEGVDVWVGTSPVNGLDALLCVVDLPKGEVEVKLLLRCTEGKNSWPSNFKASRPTCWRCWSAGRRPLVKRIAQKAVLRNEGVKF